MNRPRALFSLLVLSSLVGCALAGCTGSSDHVTVTETGTYADDGTAHRASLAGCPAYDAADDRAFVVGSSIEVDYGRALHCLETSGGWLDSHCVRYEEAPASVELTSDHPEVLSGADDHWTFVAPGVATLVLRIDGQETVRRRFRAEALGSVDVRVVAQPAVDGGYVGTDDVAADVRSVEQLTLVRGGPGARVILRPLSPSGEALCGRLPVRGTGEGASLAVAPGYDGSGPMLNGVLRISVGASTPRDAELALTVGASGAGTLPFSVVEPSELTELRVHDARIRDGHVPLHMLDATTFAGEREVFGASIATGTTGVEDCTDASVFGVADVDAPGDTRVIAESYCGDEAAATITLSIAGAHGVAPVAVQLR